MSREVAIQLTGVAVEVAVVAIVFQRRIARQFPVFSIYLIWSLFTDVAGTLIRSRAPASYLQIFVLQTFLDSLLQFAVLVELSWSVLRPIRSSLPRRALFIIAALVLGAAAAVWPLAGITALPNLPPQWHTLVRVQQTAALVRILFFLLLAAFSQFLALGWKHRELQVATGLGFYSLVSLGAALLQTHQASAVHYHTVDLLVAISYLGSLLYWTYSFMQKEAPRQEFSPRMQSLLLSVAGAARADRLTIEDIRKSGRR